MLQEFKLVRFRKQGSKGGTSPRQCQMFRDPSEMAQASTQESGLALPRTDLAFSPSRFKRNSKSTPTQAPWSYCEGMLCASVCQPGPFPRAGNPMAWSSDAQWEHSFFVQFARRRPFLRIPFTGEGRSASGPTYQDLG